jgi:hypothetical protein
MACGVHLQMRIAVDLSMRECVSPVICAKLVFGRFGSVVMDEDHLYHAARYVCLN